MLVEWEEIAIAVDKWYPTHLWRVVMKVTEYLMDAVYGEFNSEVLRWSLMSGWNLDL